MRVTSKLPEKIPAHFSSTYTPIAAAGTSGQIKHVARLIASQLTAAGLGPGLKQCKKENARKRCVGGFTQNSNESLNNVIWRIALKVHHSGAAIVLIAANIGACTFNEGAKTLMIIMQQLNIDAGQKCTVYCKNQDQQCIDLAQVWAQQATRGERIARRARQSTSFEATVATENNLMQLYAEDDEDDDDIPKASEAKRRKKEEDTAVTAAAVSQTVTKAPRTQRIKTLKLSEITKPFEGEERDKLAKEAVGRILKAERCSLLGGVPLLRNKILTVIASQFDERIGDGKQFFF
ncbi:hypothetical protein J437_LFUL017088 [Ladona fulva]|uniref:Uncharacterized protein n=1 Tax=Ladona fulva TaxID=123851 RepID=A0A8K0P961_LADFU|nr:hypothetical protein J437_LFUL017088 [Ladona fulva]